MKKMYSMYATAVILAVFGLCLGSVAQANDKYLERPINNILFKNDKNGNLFATIMITEKRTMNGISYTKEVPVMAFGDVANTIRTRGIKKGDTLKGIVTETTRGNTVRYTLVGL